MSEIEREESNSDKEIYLLLERFKRYVKLTTSPSKKKKTSALKTSKHHKKEGISIEDMGLNDKPSQEVFSREGNHCYECGGFGHVSSECGNLKDRRKGKALATLWDKYEDEENPSSDEELAIIYTEFGAKSVEVEVDGKVAFTCDPQEEQDIEVVGEATHRDLAHSSSRDKFDDLDEGEDSFGEMEFIEDDTSVEYLSSHSTNGNVESLDLNDYKVKVESSMMRNKNEIRRLEEVNLELSSLVDHLCEEVVRSMEDEDKLKEELSLSKRREEELERELEEVKVLMAKMTSSTEKLDHMLRVGRKPSDKSGLGYIDDKDASSTSKSSVVMDKNIMMSPPPQHPRKKIDLGECSRSAQAFEAPKGQAQAHTQRAPQANFPQTQIFQGKSSIMQAQVGKQPRQPQRQGKAPIHAKGNGTIPNFIPVCHYCGINGHIRPNCLHYIDMCRTKSMIEKKKARAKMHVHKKEENHLHDPLSSSTLEPLSTRIDFVSPKWIKYDEPACYETNKSQIGSTKSYGLSRSKGPHQLHY
jgi:hypothetical protein